MAQGAENLTWVLEYPLRPRKYTDGFAGEKKGETARSLVFSYKNGKTATALKRARAGQASARDTEFL